jgi:hypothetical protein
VHLDIPASLANVILEQPAGSIESIADRDIDILMRMVRRGITANDDLVTGYVQVDANLARSRSSSRCATCARSSKQIGRRVRRSNRWPPPRNSLPFPWSPGLSRGLHGRARNAIWLWSVYLTGASALFCRFGGGSDANNVEGSGGHLGRPGGGRVKSGNGDVPLCGGLQVL